MPGLDAVQLSGGELHPALAAGAVAGAGRVNGNIGAAGQFQQVIPYVALGGNGLSAFDIKYDLWHGCSLLSS